MLTKIELTEIKNIGIQIDQEMSFTGKSKGNKHLNRAVRIAKHIATKYEVDKTIVEAGAWLHDTALPSGDDYNYEINKKIVLKILSKISISKKDKVLIAECVASHEGTKAAQILEAQIVHDADVLEKIGILGIIRHTWKMTNLGKINPEKISKKDTTIILNHIKWRKKQLKTTLAQNIATYLDIKIADSKILPLVQEISKMASLGIITEKIAQKIGAHLTLLQIAKLKEQLTLSYLKYPIAKK